jgi:two-component system, NtrC family, nitrogen regulation sensor histidine kinase NtrY
MLRINHWNFGTLLLSLIFFSASLLLEHVSFNSLAENKRVRSFEETLQEKELYMYRLFDEIAYAMDSISEETLFSSLYGDLSPRVENQGIDLILFHSDSLRFWTCNSINTDRLTQSESPESDIVYSGNSWYLKKERVVGDWRVVGLILIKHEFNYQNNYLQNNFQEDFHLPEGTQIDTSGGIPNFLIHDSWNRAILSLDFSQVSLYSPFQSNVSLVLYFMGILLFLLYLRHLVKSIESPRRKNKAIVIVAFIMVILDAILLKIPMPDHLIIMEIFRPEQYAASNLFPTLADLLLSSLFIFFLIYIFYTEFSMPESFKRGLIRAWQIVYFLGFLFYYLIIMALFESLIVNSSISFEAYRVLELSSYTFVGLLIIAFHFTGITILMDKYFKLFHPDMGVRNLVLHVSITGLVVWLGGYFLSKDTDIMPAVIIMSVLATVGVIRGNKHRPFRYSSFVLLIFMYSILSVYNILVFSAEKQKNEKMVLAVDLSAEHDPVAELLLTDIETKIAADKELEFLIVDGYVDELAIDDYIQRTYFNGFWEKYDLQFTLCSPVDSLFVQPFDAEWFHCHEFFEEMQAEHGIKIPGSRFYFIDNMNGRISYFAPFDYYSADSSETVTLFLELDSRLITEELGYPELLLSDRFRKGSIHKEYTYAKYFDGRLITQSGDYSYNLRSDMYSTGIKEFEFSSGNGHNHLAYNMDPLNTIVVSSPRSGILNIAISFTYIFVFFYLLVTVNLLIINIPFLRRSLQLNIKNKIQYTMISVLVLSLLLIGSGTIFFSIRQYRETHNASLSEKIQSVYIEVTHKLEFERELTSDWQAVGYASLDELLKKFSNVFYSDINLYDPNGSILATSRSEIFDNSLLGPNMHPAAFLELSVNEAAEFVHEEKIGSLNYLSAYVPFRNSDNKLLAYLNLPYFTRQKALTMEISNLVVAVVNFYVLLITISVLIAVFFSTQITQPLRMIQEKFGKIALGKTNEKIHYEGRDEIGNLVSEYNHMVDELAWSAEKLARSERESAWREMAKQIAHEIKNPLTPMKLSVQHLQKTSSEDKQTQKKDIERITQTLIEQIDHLSNIATEFSNFAKMPGASNDEVDLTIKIKRISELFLNTEQIKIETELLNDRPALVFADREQLSRVFINLIKNAIQSIPEEREGKIGIRLETIGSNVTISILDNGKGIPDELGDKLFQPNFTTKSSGMGMGLAIVKSIIENAGGTIHYTTALGKGTSFIINLPLHPGRDTS